MVSVTSSILATLVYADIFDYPLCREEIWKYFIGKHTTYAKFCAALEKLIKSKKITQIRGQYFLSRRSSLVNLKLRRQKSARKKLPIAQNTARLMQLVPSVWLVGISGGLAMNNAPTKDDIDLFIITAPHTLWITRLLVTLWLDIWGKRRRPGDQDFQNKICLNMFMDGAKLKLPKDKQNLFTAHEIAQLKPIFDRQQIYQRFLQANSWVEKFLPHILKKYPLIRLPNKIQTNSLICQINKLCQRLQLWHMQKRRTDEKITPTLLMFHPQDIKESVRKAYFFRLQKLGIDKPRWSI